MAERFVSPGVFTKENDLTFLQQGIAEIGGAFIGASVKGPAFVPTVVESADEFRDRFGDPIPEFYMPHAAVQYLQDAARATVTRVLGLDGFELDANDNTSGVLLSLRVISGSDDAPLSPAVDVPLALMWPTRNPDGVTDLSLVTASLDNSRSASLDFDLTITNSAGTTSSFTSMSVDPASANYIVIAFGESPAGTEVGFMLLNFPRATDHSGGQLATTSGSSIVLSSGSAVTNALFLSGSTFGRYDGGETPWIQSQTVGGKIHNLFKVHTFSDGDASNREVKVTIQATRPAASNAEDQHGTFSLLVRTFGDTDSRQTVLEQFDNLSIDPNNANYFARIIGDQFNSVDTTTGELTEEGEYPAASRFVYIEVAAGLVSIPDTALPAGFQQLRSPLNSTAQDNISTGSYVTTRFETPTGASESIENIRIHYGFDFADATNVALLNPIPSGSSLIGSAFNLQDLTGSDLSVAQAVTSGTIANASLRKFTVPLQQGFDGLNPARVLATGADITAGNTQGFDLTLSTSPGSKAFKQAIDILSNPEAFDINLLVIPGVLRQLHSYVTQLAIDACESRGDCFYVMDNVVFGSVVDTAINTVAGVDSNYASVWHPWVKILDPNSNKNIWVTPSTVMPQVFAFNDKVAAPWFAPAARLK